MKTRYFVAAAIVVLILGAVAPRIVGNGYVFYAGFIALQYVVIATAWNILGGYAGFVNFGSGAFVGVGVYAAIFLFNALHAPLWAQILGAACVGGLLGLGMGYLTLRIQGVYFSIGTLALTTVVSTVIVNWSLSAPLAGRPSWRPTRRFGSPTSSAMSFSRC